MDLDRTPLGIAGAGTMGAGIAAAARDAGLRVVLHDPDPATAGTTIRRAARRTRRRPRAAAATG